MAVTASTLPEETYTYDDFIAQGSANEITYDNFLIRDKVDGYPIPNINIIDFYEKEIMECCVKVTEFTPDEINKYKYNPDILAWDLYKNSQLDFLILYCNDMIDPKEFTFKKGYLMLPKPSVVTNLMSAIYNAEYEWLSSNKSDMKN